MAPSISTKSARCQRACRPSCCEPGNVRELQNCIERASALAQGERVALEDLPEKIRDHKVSRVDVLAIGTDPTTMPRMEEVERRYIRQVLDAVSGNKSLAAQILGFDRRTIYRKLDRIRADRSDAPEEPPARPSSTPPGDSRATTMP